MNYATTQLLADIRTADRLATARRRGRQAHLLCLLRTQPRMEPAELPVLLSGRRFLSPPRWWTALQKGETVATPASRTKVPAQDCTEC